MIVESKDIGTKAAATRRRKKSPQEKGREGERLPLRNSTSAYSHSSSFTPTQHQQSQSASYNSQDLEHSTALQHSLGSYGSSSFNASQQRPQFTSRSQAQVLGYPTLHSASTSRPQQGYSNGRFLTHEIPHQLGRSLLGVFSYLWDLILGTMIVLRPLFSFVLALAFIILLLAALTQYLVVFKSEVQTRVVCKIPGVSYLMHCPLEGRKAGPAMMHVPDFADLVNKQAASYELIADSLSSLNPAFIPSTRGKKKGVGDKGKSMVGRKGKATNVNDDDRASRGSGGIDGEDDEDDDPYGLMAHTQKGGPPLAMLLKRAELAVVDLKVLVKYSTLPEESKMLLVERLQAFHMEAKTIARQLQFLQIRANGCLDGLVIRNVYLTLELDRLEEHQMLVRDGGGGPWGKILDFFTGSHDQHIEAAERKLQQLYQATMADAEVHVRDLIFKAKGILESLEFLSQLLSSIHEIVTQERRQQNQANDETLALLWSRLGGNRLQRGNYRDNLELLKDMEGQRKATVGQIQAAVWKLVEFEAEIAMLRERISEVVVHSTVEEQPQVVTAPGVDGRSAASPGMDHALSLKAHIQQIDLVTGRLKDRGFLANVIAGAPRDGRVQGAVGSP